MGKDEVTSERGRGRTEGGRGWGAPERGRRGDWERGGRFA